MTTATELLIIAACINFIGLVLLVSRCNYLSEVQTHLTETVRGLRTQAVRDRQHAPPTRPIIRNRELMAAGNRIADGSLRNQSSS